RRPGADASAVVKELVPDWWSGIARSEGVEPPACGFGSRDVTVTRAQDEDVNARTTDCARCGRSCRVGAGARRLRLPAMTGIADSIGPPESTRVCAVARREVIPELWFGGEHA